MIRAGVIWNPKSHRNRGGDPTPPPGVVVEVAPSDPDQLIEALQRIAGLGVDLLVIDGGDGTIREVVTHIGAAFGENLPRLAVIPSGKTNALALDVGCPLGTTLEQLLAAADAGRPTKRRPCLEIVRPGQETPERRGFLFGLGAFVHATELAQAHHGLGILDGAAVATTLVNAAWHTLLGGPEDPWRRGEAVRLSIDPDVPRWFIALASTLKRFPLALKPFGEPRDGLKVLAVEAPPSNLFRAVPAILVGRDPEWLAAHGYRRADVDALEVDFESHFVLDGEVYTGGALTVRRGPEFEFVVP